MKKFLNLLLGLLMLFSVSNLFAESKKEISNIPHRVEKIIQQDIEKNQLIGFCFRQKQMYNVITKTNKYTSLITSKKWNKKSNLINLKKPLKF